MGYCVNGGGTVTLGNGFNDVAAKELCKWLNVYGNNPGNEYDLDKAEDGTFDLCISLYEKSYDDQWHGLFEKLKGCVIEGSFEFIGEDGCMWRFRFDPDSQEWVDERGEVVYELDRELVAAALREYAAAHPDEEERVKAALVLLDC